MLFFSSALLFAFAVGIGVHAQTEVTCPTERPQAICAMYIRPYSDNAWFWQNICEFNASSDALIADDVERFDEGYGCDYPYIVTCCAELIGCADGVDCTGPETELPGPEIVELPDDWVTAVPCAVDNPDRVLANVIVSYQQSTTPYSCVQECIAKGYQYAGVEYGDECYCGTGYVGGVVPPAANVSDCNMLCAGDYVSRCGGSWRMQIYKAPGAP